MKVPKIFIPENKSLDEKVARLCESSVEARLCIRDMLLQKYSFDLVTSCELTDFAFKINYPFLDTGIVKDKICASYYSSEVIIHALRFYYPINSVQTDVNKIVACVDIFNSKNHRTRCRAILKEDYAVFIYTKDSHAMNDFINSYKKKFNFEEVGFKNL